MKYYRLSKMMINVLLYGSYGWKNLGDELNMISSIYYIKNLLRESYIHIISGNPNLSYFLIKIFLPEKHYTSIKIHKLSTKSLIFILIYLIFKCKVLVLGGGLLFQKNMARRFAILSTIAKLFSKKVIFLSIGVDLKDKFTILDKIFSYFSFYTADYIWARDYLSYRILRKFSKRAVLKRDIVDIFFPILFRELQKRVKEYKLEKSFKKFFKLNSVACYCIISRNNPCFLDRVYKYFKEKAPSFAANKNLLFYFCFSENEFNRNENDTFGANVIKNLLGEFQKKQKLYIKVIRIWDDSKDKRSLKKFLIKLYIFLTLLKYCEFCFVDRLHGYILIRHINNNAKLLLLSTKVKNYIVSHYSSFYKRL